MPKIIPDAVSNLSLIVARDLAFVDKTSSLEIFEQSKSCISLFLRPRRFGKTMLTEFLLYYYDAALEPQSKKLFAGKYIATRNSRQKFLLCAKTGFLLRISPRRQ